MVRANELFQLHEMRPWKIQSRKRLSLLLSFMSVQLRCLVYIMYYINFLYVQRWILRTEWRTLYGMSCRYVDHQLSFHLQRRLHRAKRRSVHGLRRRQVQTHIR